MYRSVQRHVWNSKKTATTLPTKRLFLERTQAHDADQMRRPDEEYEKEVLALIEAEVSVFILYCIDINFLFHNTRATTKSMLPQYMI